MEASCLSIVSSSRMSSRCATQSPAGHVVQAAGGTSRLITIRAGEKNILEVYESHVSRLLKFVRRFTFSASILHVGEQSGGSCQLVPQAGSRNVDFDDVGNSTSGMRGSSARSHPAIR